VISDALHELVAELDRYLDPPDWLGHYGTDDELLVRRLRRLRDEADDIRFGLDVVGPAELVERVYNETDARYRVEPARRWDMSTPDQPKGVRP